MKNLSSFLVVAFIIFTSEYFAQTFGIKAGLNLSNMVIENDNGTLSDDYDMNTGFHIGPIVEFPINQMFSFETGLLLSTRGYTSSEKETFQSGPYKYEESINLLYFDIPLTAKATYKVGNTKIYGVLGPYLGMGLSGNVKTEETYNGETDKTEQDIEWGSDEGDDLSTIDFGLTIGAGVVIRSFQIGITYGLGLANIAASTQNGQSINNRVLGISAGYRFRRK